MPAKKKSRKDSSSKLNPINIAVFIFLISISLLIVALGTSIKHQQISSSEDPQILKAAHQFPEVFEYYNIQK